MNIEQSEHVFEAFTQADSSITRTYGGTGLGLKISKKLAELMGGDITMEAIEGEGCCFNLTINTGNVNQEKLVLSEDARPDSSFKKSDLSIEVPSLTGRILYAEDNVKNQQLVSQLVHNTHAAIVCVGNGSEAIKAVQRSNEANKPFDLILMDIQMPILSGIEATQRLRSLGINNPIVALSANVMEHEVKNYLEIGCDDYLAKPIDRASFYNILKRYLIGKKTSKLSAASIEKDAKEPGVNGRVLIVDDNAANLRLLNQYLSRFKLELATATNGREAVDLALAQNYNLILMDINMPIMGGEEAVSLLRTSGYKGVIHALTAESDTLKTQRYLTNGFDGFLEKPIDWTKLMSVVTENC